MHNQQQSPVILLYASYMFRPQHGQPQGGIQQSNKTEADSINPLLANVENMVSSE